MPGGASGGASGPNANGARTTFRPPWVKDGPKPIPMATAPWAVKRQKEAPEPPTPAEGAPARKTSSVKIVPMQPMAENGTAKDPHTFERPKLREVPKAETAKPQPKEVKVPVTLNRRPSELPMAVHIETKKVAEPAIPKVELKPVSRAPPPQTDTTEHRDIDKMVPAERNRIIRQESLKKVCPAPPPMPPSMPPMPPPPPPPELPFVKKEPMSRDQLEKIESLRSRPRKRPDWGALIKAIEGGKKLKHVECNDRSQPLLPQTQAKGQFIYESETANLHNQLLKQIQVGPKLKHVKTNDRSKPILEGLRKFRRQMTIEEQIMKSQSMAMMPEAEVEEEPDEMDDIDKIRDDLQSTKQMLALELRNKEAQIRENKRLLAKLANLEAELEKERDKEPQAKSGAPVSGDSDKLVKTLKDEVIEVKKTADVLEKKFHDTADQLDTAKTELDEAKRQNQILEKKLQQALQGSGPKRQSIAERRESVPVGKEPAAEEEISEEEIYSESESEEDEESAEEKQKRRAEREIRLIRNKLKSYKNKVEAARRERKNLRDQMKKNQHSMKQEKKRYHDLQKEVNKMAALMKDDEEEDEEKEESEEEETEESETESESESSEEEESSEDEDESMPVEAQKESLNSRTKRHENCLNALKKGNYMLKANVDRLQDDLNKQKEMALSLQEDLDSVLNELG